MRMFLFLCIMLIFIQGFVFTLIFKQDQLTVTKEVKVYRDPPTETFIFVNAPKFHIRTLTPGMNVRIIEVKEIRP